MTMHSSNLTAERAISQLEPVRYLKESKDLNTKSRVDAPSPGSDTQIVTGTEPAAQSVRKPHWSRNLLLAGASLAVLAGAAYYGWQYWTVGRFEVSTDDAYVQADNTTIAPKISGYISEVPVADNEQVKAGQILARIDDRDLKSRLIRPMPMSKRQRRPSPTSRRRSTRSSRPSTAQRRRSTSTRRTRPSPSRTASAMPISRRPVTAACRTPSKPRRAIAAARASVARDTAALTNAHQAA